MKKMIVTFIIIIVAFAFFYNNGKNLTYYRHCGCSYGKKGVR